MASFLALFLQRRATLRLPSLCSPFFNCIPRRSPFYCCNIITPYSSTPQIPRGTTIISQKLTKTAPFLTIRCGSSMVATAEEDNRDSVKDIESGFEKQVESTDPIKLFNAARERMRDANEGSKQAMRVLGKKVQAMRDVDDDSEQAMRDAHIEKIKLPEVAFSSLTSARKTLSSLQNPSFLSSPQIPRTTEMLFKKQTKTGPFLRIRCATSMASSVADLDFRKAIRSEIKNAEQMSNSHELEEFPYEIIDNPTGITLKRKLSGENIQIVTRDGEHWAKHFGRNSYKRCPVPLRVTIDKGEGHTLNFNCHLFSDGERLITSISLQKRADAEDEAYYQVSFSVHLRMALHQYLEVRGINSYLFDFYREYMMKKDKRVCAAGKFMLKKDKRACAEAKHIVSAADDNLKRQTELDAQVVEQFESPNKVHELPEDFPFQIIDNHGLAQINLERKLACENVKVTVCEDERKLESCAFRIVVMVNKKEGPSLRFRCKLDLDGLDIESMKKSDKVKGKARQWSDFSDLVDCLDMHRYLEIKGIKSSLLSFFDEYIKKEMTRTYLLLSLENVPVDMRSNTLKDYLVWLKSFNLPLLSTWKVLRLFESVWNRVLSSICLLLMLGYSLAC